MKPSLSATPNGVALLGEALGEAEAAQGKPFVGPAGFKLTRLIEWAGFRREDFDIYNTVWCRPPQNKLHGTAYEKSSINHCKEAHWGSLLDSARVLVPLGNVPLGALTGREGILSTRGYVRQIGGRLILPTVHPSFIQRGQSKYSAPFINDLQKAVQLAREGFPTQQYNYVLDPSPMEALQWARRYRFELDQNPSIRLAYDIETPYKVEDESELETEDDDDLQQEVILRIGFSYASYAALSIPFDGSYRAAISELLGSKGEKVVWNSSFDTPRLRRQGIEINGLIHDGMIAWHVLHSDLPKGLGFVATFTCPWQEEWKHLSNARPAFYNATDADVELRSMIAIESELRRTGLWSVYDRDVVQLEPILEYMSSVGMPVDSKVRAEKARLLTDKQAQILNQMIAEVPSEARRIEHIYVKTPPDTTGLVPTRIRATVKRCNLCGLEAPTKTHFKTIKRPTAKRKQNSCSGAGISEAEQEVTRWARYADFKPSREQLIRYNQSLNRPIPTEYDKQTKKQKPSMGKKSLKKLIGTYPDDKLYPLVLTYRDLEKIAGTYIGRIK